jgi:serine/threonine protein phosphatase PrpC
MKKIFEIYSKNTEFPKEDHWISKEDKNGTYLVLADGVTRYLLRNAKDDIKNTETKKEQLKEYPNPSPAKLAAETFCNSVIKEISGSIPLKQIFKIANNKILEFGFKKNPEPNLMENDYWGCVASVARIRNSILEWGFICDCGICVWDKKGNIKFKTQDEGTQTVNDMYTLFKPYFGEEVKNAQTFIGRVILRGLFQNRLTYPRGDIKKGFGVINGDKNALDYVRTGKLKLKEGDIIGIYSDGLTHCIPTKELANLIKKWDFEKVKSICDKKSINEGTLILFRNI